MAGVAGARASGTCYINEARYKTASAERRETRLLTAEIARGPAIHPAAGVPDRSPTVGRCLQIARRRGAVKHRNESYEESIDGTRPRGVPHRRPSRRFDSTSKYLGRRDAPLPSGGALTRETPKSEARAGTASGGPCHTVASV